MPTLPAFPAQTFNTNLLPLQSVIMDDTGILDPGPITNAAALGYSAAQVAATIEGAALSIGLDPVIYDVAAQFPGATTYFGVSVGYSNGTTTVVSADNGIRGTSGSDIVLDGVGSDIISTAGGDDLIFAGGAGNAVHSGSGNDIVVTGAGDDSVVAGGGHDFVYLHSGDDKAFGGGGQDEMRGDAGQDSLDGQGGRDTVSGGSGDDQLWGGRGADVVAGGTGDDTMEGGAGRDRFLFNLGDETDVITDFEDNRDRLVLDVDLGAASLGDLAGLASTNGSDLTLTFASGDAVTLLDIDLSDLTAQNVDFV